MIVDDVAIGTTWNDVINWWCLGYATVNLANGRLVAGQQFLFDGDRPGVLRSSLGKRLAERRGLEIVSTTRTRAAAG